MNTELHKRLTFLLNVEHIASFSNTVRLHSDSVLASLM